MDRRITFGAALCGVALAAPLVASAQSGTENYYYPPTIKTLGKSTLPVAGSGQVVVKVLVKSDGSATVQSVIKSTNHADDAVALDIAKNSTYHPAARGLSKKPQTAFYDFTVKFAGGSASAQDSGTASTGGLGSYEAMIREGKYAAAETGLNAYLQTHGADQSALVDLGVAQSLDKDDASAAVTFDKVTTVPDKYRALAARAYVAAGSAATAAKQNDAAVTDAKKAVALSPTAYTSNSLATAELGAGDSASAIADFQKARAQAESSGLKPSERAAIDVNLVAALLGAGKDDDAKPIVAEIKTLDPTNAALQNTFANRYIKQAQDADAAQKPELGEGYWEQAASSDPTLAGTLYGHAALDEVTKKSGSDLAKAKIDADKGLAADPNNALANYVSGYILAKQGKKADALTYLNKADASAKSGGDTSLDTAVQSLIKQVNGS